MAYMQCLVDSYDRLKLKFVRLQTKICPYKPIKDSIA